MFRGDLSFTCHSGSKGKILLTCLDLRWDEYIKGLTIFSQNLIFNVYVQNDLFVHFQWLTKILNVRSSVTREIQSLLVWKQSSGLIFVY